MTPALRQSAKFAYVIHISYFPGDNIIVALYTAMISSTTKTISNIIQMGKMYLIKKLNTYKRSLGVKMLNIVQEDSPEKSEKKHY